MANQISIVNGDQAMIWNQQVEGLNKDTYELLKATGTALKEVGEGAYGAIVDDIVSYGDQILEGVERILEGMGQIITVVDKIVKGIRKLAEKYKEAAQSKQNI